MPTPSPAATAPLSLTRAMVIHITLQATYRPMGIHIDIRKPLAARAQRKTTNRKYQFERRGAGCHLEWGLLVGPISHSMPILMLVFHTRYGLWYGYWHPWRWMPGYWEVTPYTWPWTPMPEEQEISILEQQASMLEAESDNIKERLEELKK